MLWGVGGVDLVNGGMREGWGVGHLLISWRLGGKGKIRYLRTVGICEG